MGSRLRVLPLAVTACLHPRPQVAHGAASEPRVGIIGWHWLACGLGLQVAWVQGISPLLTAPGLLVWGMPLGLLAALRFVWLNRRYRGLWLLALGAGLNLAVMAANGGLMPVAPTALQAMGDRQRHRIGATLPMSKDGALPDSAARLAPLDDRLVFRLGALHMACSIGDLLVLAGCLVTLGEELACGSSAPAARPGLASRAGGEALRELLERQTAIRRGSITVSINHSEGGTGLHMLGGSARTDQTP